MYEFGCKIENTIKQISHIAKFLDAVILQSTYIILNPEVWVDPKPRISQTTS